MKVLKIQTKNLLSMKITVNYLNFVFRIELQTNISIEFEFGFSVYQKREMTLWVHGLLTSFPNIDNYIILAILTQNPTCLVRPVTKEVLHFTPTF